MADEVKKIEEDEEIEGSSGLMHNLFGVRLPLILVLPLLAIAIAGAIFTVREYPEVLGLSKSQDQLQAEARLLLDEINEVIDLPDDEVPTIATVTDVEKVREQQFFSKAENGDRVLIYGKSRKVILYRPSERRVIEVGAVNINQNAQAGITAQQQGEEPVPSPEAEENSEPSPSPEPEPISFVIYNGTTTPGLTANMQDELLTAYENAEIVDRANASRRDYEATFIIPINADNELGSVVAQNLNVALSQAPEGEILPQNADFLVIVGTDRVPAVSPEE